ncbi:MAG TPA: ABC transporter substrate-binding protein [Burkholderiaceae bacterium]|nr:ABC transporter substrate-binding protein [Burkholderiaceae bacterium]
MRLGRRRSLQRLAALAASIAVSDAKSAANSPQAALRPVRIGLLRYGTVAWEIDTMRHHRLDVRHGVTVHVRELASNEALKIALQAGAVDLIVTDWLWVARQRADGVRYCFVPYSCAVGALLVPAASPLRSLGELRGRRVGVAGGPLDKSWLLLRALVQRDHGFDAGGARGDSEPVFGAPPLLAAELQRGRLDAVLTYWHHAARLQAAGARTLASVSQIIAALGIAADVPMLGFALHDDWAERDPQALAGFVAASLASKALLDRSNDEWHRLVPLLGADDAAVAASLRDGYRAGIPRRWGAREREAAAQLHAILARIGGERLVGRAAALPPGTFWPGALF